MKTIITLTICMLLAASSFAASTRVDSDFNVNGTFYLNGSPLAAPDKLLKNQGAWDAKALYSVGDVVSSFGSTYISINTNSDSKPPNDKFWSLLAQGSPTGTCGSGQILKGFNADGSLSCGYLPVFVSSFRNNSGRVTAATECQNFQTVTILAPAAGIIKVETSNWYKQYKETDSYDLVYLSIIGTPPEACTIGVPGTVALSNETALAFTSEINFPLATMRTFAVTQAGYYTYTVNTWLDAATTSLTNFMQGYMTATWYPN